MYNTTNKVASAASSVFVYILTIWTPAALTACRPSPAHDERAPGGSYSFTGLTLTAAPGLVQRREDVPASSNHPSGALYCGNAAANLPEGWPRAVHHQGPGQRCWPAAGWNLLVGGWTARRCASCNRAVRGHVRACRDWHCHRGVKLVGNCERAMLPVIPHIVIVAGIAH